MRASIEHCPGVLLADTLTGAPGVVDLWYWLYERTPERVLMQTCAGLMSSDERDRCRAFRFERDRCLFLATRALARTVLSRYASVSPAEWRFSGDASGKPHITHPAVVPTLHFNLSNTPGLVACAVRVAPAPVGVDAERTERVVDYIGLAKRYFSPSEARALDALPSSDRPRRFFTYWTLKESYVKAKGLGLTIPLDRFSFIVQDDEVRVAFDASLADDERCWRFASLDVPPCHLIGVAANTGGAPLSLRATHIVPLDWLPSRHG